MLIFGAASMLRRNAMWSRVVEMCAAADGGVIPACELPHRLSDQGGVPARAPAPTLAGDGAQHAAGASARPDAGAPSPTLADGADSNGSCALACAAAAASAATAPAPPSNVSCSAAAEDSAGDSLFSLGLDIDVF